MGDQKLSQLSLLLENDSSINDDDIKRMMVAMQNEYKRIQLEKKYKREPFLEEEQRTSVFPLKYPEIYKMYKDQFAVIWTLEEIDFSQDNWSDLSDDYQWFIKHILAFFAGADTLVNLNILGNFVKEVPIVEAQMCYSFISLIECVHAETYGTMIKTYIKDEEERHKLFNACQNFPCVKKLMDWANKWSNTESAPFAHRVLGFVIVEGLFFSGAFCAIYWLKEQNLLPGLTKSNMFIARDEGKHCEFGCYMYNQMENRMEESEAVCMMKESVDIVKEFIIESLPCRLIGMNSDLMGNYIEYVADRLMVMLNYNKIYNSLNPFTFMDAISVDCKENFFEGRGTQYSNAHVINQGMNPVSYTNDF
jgi:ribonucleotide reductase beta subunit family protein with ferritin-like domain